MEDVYMVVKGFDGMNGYVEIGKILNIIKGEYYSSLYYEGEEVCTIGSINCDLCCVKIRANK